MPQEAADWVMDKFLVPPALCAKHHKHSCGAVNRPRDALGHGWRSPPVRGASSADAYGKYFI